MTTLHIEHAISDFTAWKASFDRYSGLRAEARVRSFEISQPDDDPLYVMVRLELDNAEDARALLEKVRELWANREATPAFRGSPRVSILTSKERRQLG